MGKTKLKDIVVILPGITGSVLQKDGEDLWAVSGQSLWQLVRTRGEALQGLKLIGDNGEEDLEDGIRASRLVSDANLVPGLIKIDGYTATANLIRQEFEVVEGDIREEQPANFFLFPYDWRRDNRVNAKILQKYLPQRLRQWREHTGLGQEAKVILLAHSMGGLVSRYYLEVLEGWHDCRALFTFGTPFRGSPNAINFLCNGFRKYLLDLTDVMRSFPSVYQLLPNYEVLRVGSEEQYRTLLEVDGDLPFVDKDKLIDAFKFHREIDEAVEKNLNDAQYLKEFKVIPMVGIKQTTLQSAWYNEGKVEVIEELPIGIDALLGDGDGTVPYRSAIPRELTGQYRETYLPQRHGSLQNDWKTLGELRDRIKAMQIDWKKVRGTEIDETKAQEPAINLARIEDYYELKQPIEIEVKLLGITSEQGAIKAKITSISQPTWVHSGELVVDKLDDGWRLTAENLETGLYRLEVETEQTSPVQEIFEVVGGEG